MIWTSEYPTKPGFYWIRNYRIDYRTHSGPIIPGPEIVNVGGDLDYITWTGDEMGVYRKCLVSAEWQGPIKPDNSLPGMHCHDCKRTGNTWISWTLDVVDGRQLYGIICRECWLKRLTPEQRKVYMV